MAKSIPNSNVMITFSLCPFLLLPLIWIEPVGKKKTKCSDYLDVLFECFFFLIDKRSRSEAGLLRAALTVTDVAKLGKVSQGMGEMKAPGMGQMNMDIDEEEEQGGAEEEQVQVQVFGEGVEECRICQGNFETGEEIGIRKCGHRFHNECLQEWMEENNKCPSC
jgi:hypothetical protein